MEDENKTQPRLTLMEEVLLLGLKDKQVRRNSSSLGMWGDNERDRAIMNSNSCIFGRNLSSDANR